MKIRRYMGKDSQEAILKVKMDLGSEAVILNTRKVRQKGFLKMFSKPLVEVLAAIDDFQGVASKSDNKKKEEKNQKSQTENLDKNNGNEKINILENKVNSIENMLQKIYEQVNSSGNKDKKEKDLNEGNYNKINSREGYNLQGYKNSRQNYEGIEGHTSSSKCHEGIEGHISSSKVHEGIGGHISSSQGHEGIGSNNSIQNHKGMNNSNTGNCERVQGNTNGVVQQVLNNGMEQTTGGNVGVSHKKSGYVLDMLYENLVKNEVETDMVHQLINILKGKITENTSINEGTSILHNLISGMLGNPETIKLREDGKPTVVIFVGPTGVGKTTTLAKIAANYSLNLKKQVGLITADTYRISAVEQLKTYAEILGMPVEVIYSINEISDALNLFKDKDLVLIDTAGRSYRNKTQFDELKMLVDASGADEVFLVLSTTTGLRNCKEVLQSYSFLKNYKLIFTKLDETPSIGLILNARRITNKNLSYVTTGQSVPDDIEVANIDKITKNLLGSIS